MSSSVRESRIAAEKNMIAGGIAGSLAKTATAPLARLTILYQVSGILNNGPLSSGTSMRFGITDSLYGTLRNIVRTEGFASLWKGNLTTVIHRFPYSALNFASFALCSDNLNRYFPIMDQSRIRFISGAMAGGISCAACYPLDIVRTRLTVGIPRQPSTTSDKPRTRSIMPSRILHAMFEIVEREGFFGLYRGLSVSLAVAVPTFAISFTVYGNVKDLLLTYNPAWFSLSASHPGNLSPVGALIAGSLSGVSSSMLIFPLDVVRKRMQIAGLTSPSPTAAVADGQLQPQQVKHNVNMSRQVQLILKQEGMKGLYRGLNAEILKVVPMVALTFCSFELVKDLLDDVIVS